MYWGLQLVPIWDCKCGLDQWDDSILLENILVLMTLPPSSTNQHRALAHTPLLPARTLCSTSPPSTDRHTHCRPHTCAPTDPLIFLTYTAHTLSYSLSHSISLLLTHSLTLSFSLSLSHTPTEHTLSVSPLSLLLLLLFVSLTSVIHVTSSCRWVKEVLYQ